MRNAAGFGLCLLFCGWGCLSSLPAADGAALKAYREVRLHVVEADGQPAAHRVVYLRGWAAFGYGCLGPLKDDAHLSGWAYTTDEHGDVKMRLGDFKAMKVEEEPGWGTYAVLVNATPVDAGAVSQRFRIGPGPSGDWAAEWGKPVPVPSNGLDLNVNIQSGITLEGRIVDDRHHDRPLSGVYLSTLNDLNIGTRTGYGSYVFGGHVTTDRNGRFVLPHQFPNALWLSVSAARWNAEDRFRPALWVETKIDGHWVPAESRVITPAQNGKIHLEMAAVPDPAYHYTGRAIDSSGRPVSGADITAGVYDNPQKISYFWCDRVGALSRNDGRYDLISPSPWVTGMNTGIIQNGVNLYGEITLAGYPSSIYPPGSYDIVVKPLGTGAGFRTSK